ncbi:unnamed protein product [Cyprideis torosa]|uniref:Uncharacterized protein n=1 Tax=Cyprideis torosa TaxID=163714 RepID=A0A7R8WKW3_9CRUS|nr:unnamed protein product [Cyprideis torosa]CAG0903708.1 unnamed protein product [Cyprideis torosa]
MVVHRCCNLPMEPDDPEELPDPYVKCYFNPGVEAGASKYFKSVDAMDSLSISLLPSARSRRFSVTSGETPTPRLTRLSPEGMSQTQNLLQAKEDHRDSSLESLSSANHSHGSSLAPPTASIIPKRMGGFETDSSTCNPNGTDCSH